MAENGQHALTSGMLDKLAALFGVQISAFEESETTVKPLSSGLCYANEIRDEDLEAISVINRIALNCDFIAQALEDDRDEKPIA
jgi:hypothetical protein